MIQTSCKRLYSFLGAHINSCGPCVSPSRFRRRARHPRGPGVGPARPAPSRHVRRNARTPVADRHRAAAASPRRRTGRPPPTDTDRADRHGQGRVSAKPAPPPLPSHQRPPAPTRVLGGRAGSGRNLDGQVRVEVAGAEGGVGVGRHDVPRQVHVLQGGGGGSCWVGCWV